MLCDICNKNAATVHLTEIIDDQMNELHLCEECARKKSVQMESQFGLSDLLAGLVDLDKSPKDAVTESTKCPKCKLTYADFKKIGRLGCGYCYTAFKKYLGPLLKRIHGSNVHLGKSPLAGPGVLKKDTDSQQLRIKLQKAVEAEEFEEAARIRDQLRELERKQAESNEDKDNQR